jgi:hypothetical protein
MSIQSFSSFNELLESMNNDSQEADAFMAPWQRDITPNMYFLKYMPEMKVCIYGKVLDPADVSEVEDEDEREDILSDAEIYSEPHMKGYRFTECYSELVPDGELGDTHVSTMTMLLSKEQFNLAMSLKWPSAPEGIRKILDFKSS